MQKTFEILKVHRQDVLKETMKKLTFPLHSVPIYGQDHEKQKRCGTSYQSLFELQNMFRQIQFLVWHFESEDCGKERKNQQNIQYLENEKSFLETR